MTTSVKIGDRVRYWDYTMLQYAEGTVTATDVEVSWAPTPGLGIEINGGLRRLYTDPFHTKGGFEVVDEK